MLVRWMEPREVEALGAVAARIWNAHYPGIISQAQIDYMLVKSYSPAALREQLASGHRFLLAVEGDVILGFLATAPLAAIENSILRGEDVREHDLFLHKFYVVPEMHGKGLGKLLLETLHVRTPETKRLRLQVARKNSGSWQFYQKRGFVIQCEADFPVGDGYIMADYVMEKRLA